MITEERPSTVVCLGDLPTLDSMSAHEKPGTSGYAKRPTLKQDRDAVVEAQCEMFSPMGRPRWGGRSVMVMGNHDDRFMRWRSSQPTIEDLPELDLPSLFQYTRFWSDVAAYRDHRTIDGICYTHVPHTTMGRPIGGVTKTRKVSVECDRPVIFGHGHDLQVSTVGDMLGGPARRFAMSAPAFMEDGNVEKYAVGCQTGWSYGVLRVRPQGESRVPSFDYLSIRDLEKLYG